MDRLNAKSANQIANKNSIIIKKTVEDILRRIELAAQSGHFALRYILKYQDAPLINMVNKELCDLGYEAYTYKSQDVNFIIKW